MWVVEGLEGEFSSAFVSRSISTRPIFLRGNDGTHNACREVYFTSHLGQYCVSYLLAMVAQLVTLKCLNPKVWLSHFSASLYQQAQQGITDAYRCSSIYPRLPK